MIYVNVLRQQDGKRAVMAELADASDLGSGVLDVGVQVPLTAVNNDNPNPVPIGDGFGFQIYF